MGEVILIRGCEWDEISSKIELRSPFSKFFLKENIFASEILTAVNDGDWFGLLSVDIFTPDEVKRRFREINFGTLFEKLKVTEDMLSQAQKDHCNAGNVKFPLHPQLFGCIDFKTLKTIVRIYVI